MNRPRNGIGFDLHSLIEGPPLMLGGVEVESDLGPEAHSDGDVLLHAACDAVLGATGCGDLGEHFPDTDPEYSGLAGEEMVHIVLQDIIPERCSVYQLDSTVLLESPRLNPYKAEIRTNLTRLFAINASMGNVKATSMEGQGVIGNKRAVAAWVSVMVAEDA